MGNPGTLYIGDVGWSTWEELNVVTAPAWNLGWPLFEGLTENPDYQALPTENLDAPNPLFDGASCNVPFFRFHELLVQEELPPVTFFPNPCDSAQAVPSTIPTFSHARPVLEWGHDELNPIARVPTFSGNLATETELGDVNSPVVGSSFAGSCTVAGVWHAGQSFPPPYAGSFFAADFTGRWIRSLDFDASDQLLEVRDFASVEDLLGLTQDPTDGSLLFVTLTAGQLTRVRYVGNNNMGPSATIATDVEYGSGPLTVRLDGTASIDPEGEPMLFQWDFGDGTTSNEPSPIHTFASAGGPTTYVVSLTVTDEGGLEDTTQRSIWIDNTPPTATINSIVNGSQYTETETLPLTADVDDAEHTLAELTHAWQVFLYHEDHFHPEPVDNNPTSQLLITSTPCDGEWHAYRVALTVTDPEGLATETDAWLYPECPLSAATVDILSPLSGESFYPGEDIPVTIDSTGSATEVRYRLGADEIGTSSTFPYSISFTAPEPGTHVLSALVIDPNGDSASSPGVPIEVVTPVRHERVVANPLDDVEELPSGRLLYTLRSLHLGGTNGSLRRVGMRFPVSLPRGAQIVSAYVQFTARTTSALPGDLQLRVEASDDAAPFSPLPFELTNRTLSQTVVTWTPADWNYAGGSGLAERTPDLAPLVQELVDRPTWRARRGHVALVIEGTTERAIESTRGAALRAPQLVVEYVLP